MWEWGSSRTPEGMKKAYVNIMPGWRAPTRVAERVPSRLVWSQRMLSMVVAKAVRRVFWVREVILQRRPEYRFVRSTLIRVDDPLAGMGWSGSYRAPAQGVWGLFSDVVAGVDAVSGNVFGPVLPYRQGVAVEVLQVVVERPQHQQRLLNPASGCPIGPLVVSIDGQSGAVVL